MLACPLLDDDDDERADPFSDLRSVSAGPRLSSRTTSRRNISASSSTTNLGGSSSTETTPPKDKPLPAGPAPINASTGAGSSLKAAIAEAVTIRPALPHTGSARSLGKLTPQRQPPQRGSSFTNSPAISLPKEQASMDDIPDYYKTDFTAGAQPENPFGKRDAAKNAKADKKDKKAAEKEAKKKKIKGGAPLDFIDTLDTIGGFHHDGPFDAANAHRNRNTRSRNPSRQAPIAAFDPASLSAEGAMRKSTAPAGSTGPYPSQSVLRSATMPVPAGGENGRPSARAAGSAFTTLDNDRDILSTSVSHPSRHQYPPVPSGPGALLRRGSEGSLHQISMGYPATKIANKDPKAAGLAEAFGIMDQEAWEDFGRTRAYGRKASGATAGAATDGSEQEYSEGEGSSTGRRLHRAKTTGGLKSERNFKAASVWDMEATLREGKPVSAVPPVPTLSSLIASENTSPAPIGNGTGTHLTPVKSGAPVRSHTTSASFSSPNGLSKSVSGGLAVPEEGSPKRSKSLVARIKKGVKSPNVPMPSSLPSDQDLLSSLPPTTTTATATATTNDRGEGQTPPRPPRPTSFGSPSPLGRSAFNPAASLVDPRTSPPVPRSPEASRHEFFGGAAGGIGSAPESPARKPTLFQKIRNKAR